MLPHVFSHDEATHILSFRQGDNLWLAGLYRRGDTAVRLIPRFPQSGFSDEAIRVGYITVATCLVKFGLDGCPADLRAWESVLLREPDLQGHSGALTASTDTRRAWGAHCRIQRRGCLTQLPGEPGVFLSLSHMGENIADTCCRM
jgi:hypothetical protein